MVAEEEKKKTKTIKAGGGRSQRAKEEEAEKRQLQTESWCELAQSAKPAKSIAGGGGKV